MLKSLAALAILALAGGLWWTTRPEPAAPPPPPSRAGSDALVQIALPQTLDAHAQLGESIFAQICAACHGEAAVGRDGIGPPLVHRIYEPSHHADEAFQIAVVQGVRAHHWTFGNMPRIEGLTRADVAAVIAYVRTLQRANGIN